MPSGENRRTFVVAVISFVVWTHGCAGVSNHRDFVLEKLGGLAMGYVHQDPSEILRGYSPDFVIEDPFARALPEIREEAGILTTRGSRVLAVDGFRKLLERDLARFSAVSKAKFVLDDLREVEGGYEVDAWFNLYATKNNGHHFHEESWHRFLFEPSGEGLLIRRHEVLSRTENEGGEPHFVDRSAEVGLGGSHRSYVVVEETTPIIPGNFSGSGASAGDLDGDGYLDLIVGDGQASRLFHNRGDGTFEDVTDEAGMGGIGGVRGAYFWDYDNDGLLDILLTRVKADPVLLRNLGSLRFERDLDAVPPGAAGQGESAAMGDLDGDGDLDLYLVQYGDFAETSWAYPLYDSQDGKRSVVWRNDGNGFFEPVDDPVLTPPGWGLAAAMADYDDDGDLDIYVVNDFGVNHLIRNDGDFRFTDVTEEAGVADQGFGMSAAFGDYDADGDLDIYVANMFSSARWVFEDPSFPLPTVADFFMLRGFIKGQMRTVTRGNSLFQNQGDGTFKQIAEEVGVERAGWAWGANFFDADNDGDLDLYCPNGFITGAKKDDL